MTLALCEDQVQAVEDAYLAALGDVEGWIIDAGVLELSDGFGDVILTFEVPHILWTTSQMTGLMATLESLRPTSTRSEVRSSRCATRSRASTSSRLRERIKALEADNKTLKKRSIRSRTHGHVDPTPGPGGSASFSGGREGAAQGHPSAHRQLLQPVALVPAQGYPGRGDLHAQDRRWWRASTTTSWKARRRGHGFGDHDEHVQRARSGGGGPDLRSRA